MAVLVGPTAGRGRADAFTGTVLDVLRAGGLTPRLLPPRPQPTRNAGPPRRSPRHRGSDRRDRGRHGRRRAPLRPRDVVLGLDGATTTVPVRLVAVGNTPWYGGGMTVCPGADPAACADGEPVAPLPVVAGCVPGALRIDGPVRA